MWLAFESAGARSDNKLRINAPYVIAGSLLKKKKATVRPREEIMVAGQPEQHKYALASILRKKNIYSILFPPPADMIIIDCDGSGVREKIFEPEHC